MDDDEAGRADAVIPAGTSYFPSAMGLSFVLDGSVSQIVVQANWGQYRRVKSETQVTKDGKPATGFKRKPISCPPLTLPLVNGALKPQALHPDHPAVLLQGRMRQTTEGWIVTLFMVNQQLEAEQGKAASSRLRLKSRMIQSKKLHSFKPCCAQYALRGPTFALVRLNCMT